MTNPDTLTPSEIADALEALILAPASGMAGADRIQTIHAAAQRIRAMELALKPFAELADVRLCGRWRDDESTQATDLSYRIKFGHLRAARSALSLARGED